MTARWRLQVIAELSVGRLVRESQRAQDRSVQTLHKVTRGRQ